MKGMKVSDIKHIYIWETEIMQETYDQTDAI